jgi:hypothetical protein
MAPHTRQAGKTTQFTPAFFFLSQHTKTNRPDLEEEFGRMTMKGADCKKEGKREFWRPGLLFSSRDLILGQAGKRRVWVKSSGLHGRPLFGRISRGGPCAKANGTVAPDLLLGGNPGPRHWSDGRGLEDASHTTGGGGLCLQASRGENGEKYSVCTL